jgi:hypothetical protein
MAPPYWPMDGCFAPIYDASSSACGITVGSDISAAFPFIDEHEVLSTEALLDDIHLPILLLPTLVEDFDERIATASMDVSEKDDDIFPFMNTEQSKPQDATWQDPTMLNTIKRLGMLN